MTDSDQGRRPEEKTGPIRSVADRTGVHFRNNSSSTQSYIDIGSTIPDDPPRSLLRRLHKATNPSDLRSEPDNKPPVASQHKQKPSKPRKRSPARDISHARRAAVELPVLLSPLVIKSKKGKAVLIAVPDAQPTAKRDPSKEAAARKPTTPAADAHGPEEVTTPTRATVWESPAAKRASPRAVIAGKDGRLTIVDLPQSPWVPPPAPSSDHASPPSRDAIAKTKEVKRAASTVSTSMLPTRDWVWMSGALPASETASRVTSATSAAPEAEQNDSTVGLGLYNMSAVLESEGEDDSPVRSKAASNRSGKTASKISSMPPPARPHTCERAETLSPMPAPVPQYNWSTLKVLSSMPSVNDNPPVGLTPTPAPPPTPRNPNSHYRASTPHVPAASVPSYTSSSHNKDSSGTTYAPPGMITPHPLSRCRSGVAGAGPRSTGSWAPRLAESRSPDTPAAAAGGWVESQTVQTADGPGATGDGDGDGDGEAGSGSGSDESGYGVGRMVVSC
ncbi:hypothetical protein B0A49_08404 [Cryomyces minteri]|uniref:Uncharacterized protein n=1 Tax=Cryomyces minteri TaxID=331657 RepID=A0A4U0WM48_9PEZI|nr:hypothetical protein B0A49_08404 [Cryomyces minteri]